MEVAALIASVVSIFVSGFAVWLAMTFYHKGKAIDTSITNALAAIQGQVGSTQKLMDTHLSTLVSELGTPSRTAEKLSDVLAGVLAKIPASEPETSPPTRSDGVLHAALDTSHDLIARVSLHSSVECMELALHGNLLTQHLVGALPYGGSPGEYVAWVAQRTFDSFERASESFQNFARLNPSEAGSCRPGYEVIASRRQELRDRDRLLALVNKTRGPLMMIP